MTGAGAIVVVAAAEGLDSVKYRPIAKRLNANVKEK